MSVLYGKKVNKSEIHREAQNNTKQNRVLKKARGDESREVKCGIKNGPPCAQGKLSAPTPQDSTDNSPSARETQALLVDRKASIVWIQPLSISLSSLFDHPDTAAAHLPTLAHHTYAGDDYSPPCLRALPPVFLVSTGDRSY